MSGNRVSKVRVSTTEYVLRLTEDQYLELHRKWLRTDLWDGQDDLALNLPDNLEEK